MCKSKLLSSIFFLVLTTKPSITSTMVVQLQNNNNIFLLCSIFLVHLIPHIHANDTMGFNLANINTTYSNLIRFYSNANLTNQGIELTTNMNQNETSTAQLQFTAGRAVYFESLHLYDNSSGNQSDFTTHFSFVIDSNKSINYSDGLAFFLMSNKSLDSVLYPGPSFGLPVDIPPRNNRRATVAVEFDTFHNNNWDPANIPGPHVGIDINILNSTASSEWYPDIPNGIEYEAWISYNPSSKIFKVKYTNRNKVESEFNISVDLRDYLPEWVAIGFSAATSELFEKHYVKSWQFNSTFKNWPESPTPPTESPIRPSPKNNIGLVVGLTVGSSVCVGVLTLVVGLVLWKRKKSRAEDGDDEGALDVGTELEIEGRGPKKFSLAELSRATNKFSEEEKLGEGGFGDVYRGFLTDLGSYVAVKRISKGSRQGIQEYTTEVKTISQLRHRNLVRLIGWCHDKREFLLVYEFMQNGSLDQHIFKENCLLTWSMRYKIVQGLASALLYLHEECENLVVHRDIKSSNVMLDLNFNAKLGDFGLARLIDHERGSQTTLPAGTRGYMAPEYIDTGRASKESDVYSFGIVALEIACGRKPLNLTHEELPIKLVEWVWHLYGVEKLIDAVDPKLNTNFDQKEMECLMIVGLWCAHPIHKHRPLIREAIHVLNFEAPLPSLPPKMPVATYSFLPDPVLSTTFTTSSTITSSVGAGAIVSEKSLILSAPR